MADIVKFLAACLDRDERRARDAEEGYPAGAWESAVGPIGPEVRVGGDVIWTREVPGAVWDCDDYSDYEGCAGARTGWMRQAEHIAHWGPVRVLREVEAKRRIMAVHHRAGDAGDTYRPDHCVGCGYAGDCADAVVEDINDCPELRLLAAIYDERWQGRPGEPLPPPV